VSEPLVDLTIEAAEKDPESWWITRWGTVLVSRPDIAMYIGGGPALFRFGVAMPPVYGRNEIAPIPISLCERAKLWATLKRVEEAQLQNRRKKALASMGR